jgi:hypothetical protein
MVMPLAHRAAVIGNGYWWPNSQGRVTGGIGVSGGEMATFNIKNSKEL